jgi:hypothetical protein
MNAIRPLSKRKFKLNHYRQFSPKRVAGDDAREGTKAEQRL